MKHDFYPRPPRGERRAAGGCLISLREFLSTPSARRATILCEISARLRSISIHALREESDLTALVQGLAKGQISIHALREESDPQSWQTASLLPNFYPRPPRGERPRDYHRTADTSLFLSTPSARRATIGRPLHGFFNAISIHALREESDLRLLAEQTRQQRFLSTPSARRATVAGICKATDEPAFLSTPSARRATDLPLPTLYGKAISIHALREESDRRTRQSGFFEPNFYPRPPRGERPKTSSYTYKDKSISIHALREESDWFSSYTKPLRSSFLSTPSARRATARCNLFLTLIEFLSTPSARRATCIRLPYHHRSLYFYPRPPRGERLKPKIKASETLIISIHALREESDHFPCSC